jgi:uncharacterized protein YbjT (DUF2867 family)
VVAQKVLVTGASGYVGGRLVPALLGAGAEVRCLARTPVKLDSTTWRSSVGVVPGGVGGDLREAMAGIDVAIYLVHSIGQGEHWVEQERRDAANFAAFAADAGVRRIVYLGGLGEDADELSVHLRSRHEVGRLLASTGVEVIELRAGVIIGSGSASFEMLRYLVEVLPLMVTPRWVETRCQPVAIADVVEVLVAAISTPDEAGGVFELGGPDVVSYAEMMALYAEVAGLPRRRLLRVPLLTPRLSSHWVGLVTPVPAILARELVESLVNEVTVTGEDAAARFGCVAMSLREAFVRARAAVEADNVSTSFVDADLVYFEPAATDPAWAGGTVLRDVQERQSQRSAHELFSSISAIGGQQGWYAGGWLWRLRGLLDQLVGGPGLRRGRPRELHVGEALDFWRVEDLIDDRRLRLRAEMRLPGEAWLTWDIVQGTAGCTLAQTAEYRPRGLLGRLYWLGVAPFHRFVFPGMIDGIVADAAGGGPRGEVP